MLSVAVADVGGAVSRFREFVVFDSSAIDILYLVALKRERYYCDCGEPALHRTVKNGQPQNYGRSILLCPSETGGCGFFQMLPLCHCGMSAGVAESQRGTRYYRQVSLCLIGLASSAMDWTEST